MHRRYQLAHPTTTQSNTATEITAAGTETKKTTTEATGTLYSSEATARAAKQKVTPRAAKRKRHPEQQKRQQTAAVTAFFFLQSSMNKKIHFFSFPVLHSLHSPFAIFRYDDAC